MAVRIRLSRGGSKKRPFYKIVVATRELPVTVVSLKDWVLTIPCCRKTTLTVWS